MKTVTGTVLSSKPISLSKATSILSTFVATENGASHATAGYLRRTLASFKELKQLHKELKSGARSGHSRKRHRSAITEDGDTNVEEDTTLGLEASQEMRQESEPRRKKHRR